MREFCRLVLTAVACLAALLGWAASPYAAVDEWQGIGPYGGKVLGMAVAATDSRMVYAGTNQGGLFKSTDGGVNWKLSKRLGTVYAVAVDPTDTSIVYAAATGGVQKSTDGGQTWTLLQTGANATCIAIDPVTPSTLYAGTDYGIYKSTDAGASWIQVLWSYDEAFMSIAVSKSEPGKIYASTNSGYGFRSIDGGTTWSQMSGFDYAPLYVSPANGNLLIKGSSGIPRSTDGGATWTITSSYVAANDVAFDPSNPDVAFAATNRGVFVSRDAGATWQPYSNEIVTTRLLLDPATHKPAFAAGTDGVLKSTDEGVTWASSSTGMCAQTVSFAVNPFNASELLTGSTYYEIPGGFKTEDGGASWTRTSLPASALAYDPSTPSVVYSNYGKSTDNGNTWSYFALSNVVDILIDPSNPRKLYTGFNRSTDGGSTWQDDTNGLYPERTFWHIAMGPDGSVYATGWDLLDWDYGPYRQGIFKRVNDSWTLLPATNQHGNTFDTVAVAPSNPSVVYAGYVNVFSRSTDAGQTWTNTTAGPWPLYIDAIAVDPGNADIVYIGTRYGIYRSLNGGATWSEFGLGDFHLVKLAFDSTGTSLYATGPGTSIYKANLGTAAVAEPSSYNFGAVPVGESALKKVTITNAGPAGMRISSMQIAGEAADRFSIVSGSSTCTGTIASGKSCSVEVTFNPNYTGAQGATLSIVYNSSSQAPLDIPLTGNGADIIPPLSVASPKGGLFRTAQFVTLSANEAATIHYTTDGSQPTAASAVYTAPIEISASTVLRFFAVDAANNAEAVVNAETFTIDGIAPVTTASLPGGFYAPVSVTLTANESATIYYTLDGSEPTTSSNRYAGPISIAVTSTLKYFAQDAAGNVEAVQSQTYVIDAPVATTVVVAGKTITINYSENIVSGPSFGAITLTDGAVVVPVVVGISGNTLTLEAKNPLQKDRAYTVTVPADAVLDLTGNRQEKTFVSHFTITK